MLLAGAADEPDADPGLGEVGGLLAVLLASLEQMKRQSWRSELSAKEIFQVNHLNKMKRDGMLDVVWKVLYQVSINILQGL